VPEDPGDTAADDDADNLDQDGLRGPEPMPQPDTLVVSPPERRDDTKVYAMPGPYEPAPSWVIASWNRSLERRTRRGAVR
jgi:hypothetical protein